MGIFRAKVHFRISILCCGVRLGILAEAAVYLDPFEAYGNDGASLFHGLSMGVHAQIMEGVSCHGHVDRVVIDAEFLHDR